MIKVQSLNARIRTTAKKFGTDSKVYQSYVNRISDNFPDNTYHYKNGVIQLKGIKQDSVNVVVGKTGENKTIEFAALTRIPTAKTLIARGKQGLSDFNAEQDKVQKRISEEDAIEFYKWREQLIEDIDHDKYMMYDYSNKWLDKAYDMIHQSGKRTYEELSEIRDLLNKGLQEKHIPRVVNL